MVGNLKKLTVFFKFPTVFWGRKRKKKEKVRVGEGKFLTFVFFLEENRRIEIRNIKMKSCKSTLTNPHLLRAKEMKSYSYSLFDFTCSVSIMNTVYLLPFFPYEIRSRVWTSLFLVGLWFRENIDTPSVRESIPQFQWPSDNAPFETFRFADMCQHQFFFRWVENEILVVLFNPWVFRLGEPILIPRLVE